MKLISYCLKAIEPFRIMDREKTQNNQGSVIPYIQGGTIRGTIATILSQKNDKDDVLKNILKEVEFWNVYPMIEGEVAIPSPKGFYENKAEDQLKSIFLAEETEIAGWKRAKLGQFSIIKDDKLKFASVKRGESLQINAKKETDGIFRMEYVEKGQIFQGYIASENEVLLEEIKEVLKNEPIRIGSDRTSGYGKVLITNIKEEEEVPYKNYIVQGKVKGEAYLMLLSDVAMYDKYGTIVGIDLESLERELGVSKLKIRDCATSVIKKHGYNRTYGCETPSITFYEKGSVFQITFEGEITEERIKHICLKGIGIQKNEGCGHFIFLKDYEKINGKVSSHVTEVEPIKEKSVEEKEVRFLASAIYKQRIQRAIEKKQVLYQEELKGKINSQMGQLLQICMRDWFAPEKAIKNLEEAIYERGERVKKNNKHINSNQSKAIDIDQYLLEIIDEKKPLDKILDISLKTENCVMGISVKELLTKEEEQKYRLYLLKELLKEYMRKGGETK